MVEYKCLADLQGKTLIRGDIVVFFENLRYSVKSSFLSNIRGHNDEIFEKLKLNPIKIAEKEYGYTPNDGTWPECKMNDYEALTRLVIELYKIIESPIIIGFKIKGSYLRQLDFKEARKLLKGYNVCFDESKWALDSTGWYYWNTQDFQLRYDCNSNNLESKYQDVTPNDNPNQWYKITTPGETGISPEEVKALITKYGGRLDSTFNYTSRCGVYVWTKNKEVECLSKKDAEEKHAIEVSPTTEITTIKQEEKHENQFQRKKARIERGTRPEGSTVCGRRSKASVAVGHLGYRKVTGI